MSLHHALFKGDVFRLPNLLAKNDVRRLLLLRCYSVDPNQRNQQNKIDQKFVESVRRRAEERKSTSHGPVPFVNVTNAQRKQKPITKVLRMSFDVPLEGERLSIWQRLLNWIKTLIELGVNGSRPEAFFYYRDQMNHEENLLVYVNESAAYNYIGWPFAILIPALIYRFIKLYRKEAHLSWDDKELEFTLQPWQIVGWVGLYLLMFSFFVLNTSRTVSTIYFNKQTKMFTLIIYRMPLVWRFMKNKLVVGIGQANEYNKGHRMAQLFRPNTKLNDSTMVNVAEHKFIKPFYHNLFYGHSKKGVQIGRIL